MQQRKISFGFLQVLCLSRFFCVANCGICFYQKAFTKREIPCKDVLTLPILAGFHRLEYIENHKVSIVYRESEVKEKRKERIDRRRLLYGRYYPI